jgi:hypothetical protein
MLLMWLPVLEVKLVVPLKCPCWMTLMLLRLLEDYCSGLPLALVELVGALLMLPSVVSPPGLTIISVEELG